MIIWSSGGGPRLFGCGVLLLVSLILSAVVFALSAGSCTVFIFP